MKKGLGKLGILVILVGFFFILNSSFAIITGNVVSKKVDALDSFIGIMFLISGLALFLVSELESRVSVYDISKGKKKSPEFYHMTDPSLYFSKVGNVSLNEFKRGIKEIEGDPELIQLVREEYGSQLLYIEKAENPLKKHIAEEFLRVLYHGKIPREKKELITKKEISEIRRAFDPGWSGKPNPQQTRILKEHGLSYQHGAKHGQIYSTEYPKRKTITSSTPSDVNTGKNVARQIVGLLKKERKIIN